jgi:hypothetical protein
MFRRSKTRKPVRIQTEQSQPWSTPAKTRRLSKQNQLARDHANAIFALEQKLEVAEAENKRLSTTYSALVASIPTESDVNALATICNLPVAVVAEANVLETVQYLHRYLKRAEEARKRLTAHVLVMKQMADREMAR